MAKIRVHELSKELGVESKVLIDYLQSQKIEDKKPMSALSEDEADQVRARFAKKQETAPAASAEKEAVKEEAASSEPRKKKLIRVVHPQNAQHGQRRGGNMPQQRRQNSMRRPEAISQDSVLPGMVRTAGRQAGSRYPGAVRPGQVRRDSAIRPETKQQETPATPLQEQKAVQEEQTVQTPVPDTKEVRPAVQESTVNTKAAVETPKPVQETKTEAVQAAEAPKADTAQTAGQERRNQGSRPNRDSRPVRQDAPRGDRGGRPSQERRDGGRPGNRPGARQESGANRGNTDGRKRMNGSASSGNAQRPGKDNNYQKRKGRKDQHGPQDKDRFDKKNNNNPNRPGAFHKPTKQVKPKEEEAIKMITVPATITIQELADKMKIQPSAIVKKLFMKGTMVTINQEVEYETAEEIALEFDVLCEQEKVVDYIEELLKEGEEDEDKMEKRPPVVCVMGHVDHGKTSLLDAIRHTNVIDKEAGGITQHIGAYVVTINGEKITFLDTPGHEAFTAMRLRGAKSTDIAILVVAADDGVMPQTVEAINHAKAAGIEIIVAINKIDKPGANPDRVKQELSEYELIPEDWGGKTICVPVSAKTGEGLSTLLEMVLLTAEMLELKADPKRTARGIVLEAQLDKGRGPVATVLVQKGTLHVGDPVAAGIAFGKVRAMIDDKGRRVKEAGPSKPVEILGLNDVPGAGDVFIAPETEREARNFSETFISQNKLALVNENKSKVKMSLDDLYAQIQEGNLKELGIIVKADVQGSVEAVKQSLEKLSNDEVVVKVIHGGVGAISESDVSLASASNAIIIGFNVRPDAVAKDTAEREGVDIRLYRVIYNAIEDVEAAMKGMLEPEIKEEILGHAEVRQTFHASGIGTIGGGYVLDGHFERDCKVRLIRDGVVVFEGGLASLRRFKDDVKEVRAGFECGFVFENYNDIKEGDQVEAFKMVEVARG